MSDISLQAARWFTRLLDLPADHPDRAAFALWLEQDARHAREFAEFSELWQGFSSTRSTTSLAQVMEGAQRRRFLGRSLLVLLGMNALGGWLAWRKWGMTEQYFTAIAQTRRVQLADGSEIILDADTKLQVRYSETQRQIWLLGGRAIFEVRRAPDVPFEVDAGLAKVQVLGTRFAVERMPGSVQVSVERGRVAFSSDQQRLILDAGAVAVCGSGGELHTVPRAASAAFGFERGSLVFENASLMEVATVLSRYRQKPLRVQGEPVQRLTAVVQARDVETFVHSLPALSRVTLREQADATYLVP